MKPVMPKGLTLALIILVGSANLAVSQGLSDAEQVKAAEESFERTISRRDRAALEAAWAHDASVLTIHPPSGRAVVGWEEVRKSWELAFGAIPELSAAMETPEVRVHGDVGWVVGNLNVKGRLADGKSVEYTALITSIFEKRGNAWLIVHRHASRPFR